MGQRPDNVSNHIVQKAIGRHVDQDIRKRRPLRGFDSQFHHVANRRFSFPAAGGLKAGKVKRSGEVSGRLSHRFDIKMMRHEPPVIQVQRIQNASALNLITVSLFQAVADGVEILDRGFDVEHRDVFRRFGIECPQQFGVGDHRVRRQRANLPSGVNAAIGPTTGSDADRFAGDFVPPFFQFLLNGHSVLLNLPADVIFAIVGNRQL